MWIVIIEYEFDNDIYVFENYKEAEDKYYEIKSSGQLAYLTNVIKSNI